MCLLMSSLPFYLWPANLSQYNNKGFFYSKCISEEAKSAGLLKEIGYTGIYLRRSLKKSFRHWWPKETRGTAGTYKWWRALQSNCRYVCLKVMCSWRHVCQMPFVQLSWWHRLTLLSNFTSIVKFANWKGMWEKQKFKKIRQTLPLLKQTTTKSCSDSVQCYVYVEDALE